MSWPLFNPRIYIFTTLLISQARWCQTVTQVWLLTVPHPIPTKAHSNAQAADGHLSLHREVEGRQQAGQADGAVLPTKHHGPKKRAADKIKRVRRLARKLQSMNGVGVVLGELAPFFPGILLFRKPSKTQVGNSRFLKRTVVEKNGQGINP